LLECSALLERIDGRSALEVLGAPDDLKFRSCMTLFAEVSAPGSVFERCLHNYFAGKRDASVELAQRR
jgi:uncharacterized protein (DUF1810 family)